MAIGVSVEALVSNQGIIKGVLAEIASRVNVVLRDIESPVRNKLRPLFEQLINNSPEALALQGGRLQGEMGVLLPAKAIAAIAHAVIGSMSWVINPMKVTSNNQVRGGLKIGIVKANLEEVLSLPEATYTTEHGDDIPWLEWMLVGGSQVIVPNYRFLGGDRSHSRTGLGIMVKSKTSGWSVPSPFGGIPADNWVVRALLGITEPLEVIIEKEMKVRLE